MLLSNCFSAKSPQLHEMRHGSLTPRKKFRGLFFFPRMEVFDYGCQWENGFEHKLLTGTNVQ